MKQKIIGFIKNNYYLIIAMLIFLIITSLSPISGDDYGNYISTKGTLSEAVNIAISYYKSLEGRILGRVIIMFTTRHKIFFNLLSTTLFTVTIYSLKSFIKNKATILLLIISFFLLNCDMFSQTYTWIAGSVTYFYPTCLSIIYFTYIHKHQSNLELKDILLILLLSIIIPLFVENIAVSFVLGNLILLGYTYIKSKKVNKLYLTVFIISTIMTLIMLKSPGSANRLEEENTIFNNLNLINKIIYNIKNYNFYVLFKNSYMLLISLIPINYYFKKNNKPKLIYIFNIVPLLSTINNFYYLLPLKFEFIRNINIFNNDNNIYVIFTILYYIFFIKSINYIVKNNKEKIYLYFILLISSSSSLIMLILPTWGDRITYYSVITITIISMILIDKIIKYNNQKIKIINIFASLYIIFISFVSISIYNINKYREDVIRKELQENLDNITVIRNPIMYVWNNNPQSDYFIKTYKSYMNINYDKGIEIKQLSYKEYLDIIIGRKK